ncbi:hypothetical protein BDR06DRAFT_977846 [Suillus hirtellus]|nr:hypothetical protein BDR06DRAFT_977846 [Suillus hirtellus]
MAIRTAMILKSYKAVSNPILGADYTIQCKEVDGFRPNKYGIWEGIIHPSGVMCYFEASTKTYTGFDIQRCLDDQLLGLKNWMDAARRKLQEDAWFLVIEPITRQNEYYYEYYCAVLDKRVITWSAHVQESGTTNDWSLKHNFASLFWNINQTEKIISRIVSLETRTEKYTNIDGSMKEQGVAFCGRIWNILLLVLEHIESLHVDGIVNLLDIDRFVDLFNNDNLKHSTLAGVIMAVNASILAIPNIGSQTMTIALCSMSLILGVHCIFAGIVAQHFGQKMNGEGYKYNKKLNTTFAGPKTLGKDEGSDEVISTSQHHAVQIRWKTIGDVDPESSEGLGMFKAMKLGGKGGDMRDAVKNHAMWRMGKTIGNIEPRE